jgi:hypothetical protein
MELYLSFWLAYLYAGRTSFLEEEALTVAGMVTNWSELTNWILIASDIFQLFSVYASSDIFVAAAYVSFMSGVSRCHADISLIYTQKFQNI